MNLKVFTAFSGYDSQCMALDRLHETNPEFNYELVGWSEIDKYAIQAHNAVYPQWADRNYGDITNIDWSQVPDFDMFTYSFPCTDISKAGKQEGLSEGSGTRSSLLWECRRAIATKKPKYLLMENVADLVGKRFIKLFNEWCLFLESCGYRNFAQVLNARDCDVPQNRKRVFVVSVLDDSTVFSVPSPMALTKRLGSVLESEVDEKYYLSEERVRNLIVSSKKQAEAGNKFSFVPKTLNDIASTITTRAGGRKTDNFLKKPVVLGWVRDKKGNVIKRPVVEVANCVTAGKRDNTQNYVLQRGRGYNKGGIMDICPTITSNSFEHNSHVVETSDEIFRVRKFTERECFRLMDVPDENIDKIQTAGISSTQQYKMAGNSIVVAVLYYIFKSLFYPVQNAQQTLF